MSAFPEQIHPIHNPVRKEDESYARYVARRAQSNSIVKSYKKGIPKAFDLKRAADF